MLYKKAIKIDPEAMKKISPNDKKRIIRVLEIYHKTGKTKTQVVEESRKNEVKYDYKIFGINMDRAILYDRINKRVDQMVNSGFFVTKYCEAVFDGAFAFNSYRECTGKHFREKWL